MFVYHPLIRAKARREVQFNGLVMNRLNKALCPRTAKRLAETHSLEFMVYVFW